MFNIKKAAAVLCAAFISVTTLAGCTSQDKASVKETSENFLAVVAGKSTDDINSYATIDVANGDFVRLFDADKLLDQFTEGFSAAELTDETNAKFDEFCHLFADMIKDYTVTNVEISKDGTATAVATLNTTFPIDIFNSEEASNKITEAVSKYNNDNADEIAALYEEGTEVAEKKIFNDFILIILDIYEEEIASSQGQTYAIVLNLEKNQETDSWLVTNVQDYDSSAAGEASTAQ